MKKGSQEVPNKRAEMRALISAEPGITSTEIAERLGIATASIVSTALWPALKRGTLLVEHVERKGRKTNAYYLPEQISADSVERVRQSIVEASDSFASVSGARRNSVFDTADRKPRDRPTVQSPAKVSAPEKQSKHASTFACAIASDGSLVIMRGGQIQVSLTDVETTTLQDYLVAAAAARVLLTPLTDRRINTGP